MENFHEYAVNALTNLSPEGNFLNGHTTFLMCNPCYRPDIKDHRMQWIVNNYTNYDNVDSRPYYEYYKNHIPDNYPGVFNPPPCFYNEMIREERRAVDAEDNDDIAQHYRELAARYADLLHPKNLDENNDDTYIEEFEDELSDISTVADDIDYESTDYYDQGYDWEDENEYYEEDEYDF
jgi:hypothetical protein